MSIATNVSSLNANQTFMNNNANNIANVNSQNFKPTDTVITNSGSSITASSRQTNQEQTDLTKELTDQVTIKNVTEANVSAIKTQDEMFGSLLDIKA
jgi:flagellar hook protein FlgE